MYSFEYCVPIWGFFETPSVEDAVTNTLLPLTMGDDQPRPGMTAFHSTFSVLDQVSGRRMVDTGFPWGPRNRDHSGASAAKTSRTTATMANEIARAIGRYERFMSRHHTAGQEGGAPRSVARR